MKRNLLTMIKVLIGLSILLAACTGSTDSVVQKSKADALILHTGSQLFIDEYLIAEQSFLLRTVNNPEKLDNPVLWSGRDKDKVFQPWITVLRDDKTGKFRAWYNLAHFVSGSHYSRHIGYTDSDDGIHWERPPKMLKDPHPLQVGVSVVDRGADYEDSNKRYVLAVFSDDGDSAWKKFNIPEPEQGFMVSTSPDGLNWTRLTDKPAFTHNHDVTSMHWDPIREQFIALPSISPGRVPQQSVSKDLINWEPMWQIFGPQLVPLEKGDLQFYGMSGVIERGGLLIGLVKILRDDLNATFGKNKKEMGDLNPAYLHASGAGIGYTVLAWSRDGRTWQRDYEPFIQRNFVPGTFDHAKAWGDEQVIVGDKTYIYYAGYERGHKIDRHNERHFGLAIMPRDRYISRDADLNTGTLITKPLIVNFEQLTVNANIVGEGRVRLLNAKGKPLNDFGWAEFNGDSIEHTIEWSKNLKSIAGKAVCLEFQLRNAQLFGFDVY